MTIAPVGRSLGLGLAVAGLVVVIALGLRSQVRTQRGPVGLHASGDGGLVLADPVTQPVFDDEPIASAQPPLGSADKSAGKVRASRSGCDAAWDVSQAHPCSREAAREWLAGTTGMGACVALAQGRDWATNELETEVSVPQADEPVVLRAVTESPGAASFSRCLRTVLRNEKHWEVSGCRFSVRLRAASCDATDGQRSR